jgi:hypothetical protein
MGSVGMGWMVAVNGSSHRRMPSGRLCCWLPHQRGRGPMQYLVAPVNPFLFMLYFKHRPGGYFFHKHMTVKSVLS